MDNQYTIFYSWQSDLPNNTNRGFIHDVLKKAVGNIRKTMKIDADLDRDTANVPGSPEIHTTIFEKISKADLFVADVSIINNKTTMWAKCFNRDKRKTPNPNVLIELGYALSQLGENRIILIQNLSFGNIEELPFDINKKRVIGYSLGALSNKQNVKETLIAKLEKAIELALNFNEELMRKNTASVIFAFGDAEGREIKGQNLVFDNVNFVVSGELQDYRGKAVPISNGIPMYQSPILSSNKQYYREFLKYAKDLFKYRRVSFYFKNDSLFSLSDVNIEITVPKKNGMNVVKHLHSKPSKDKYNLNILDSSLGGIAPIFADNKSYLHDCNNDYLIEFQCRNIQPSKGFFLNNEYYLGVDSSCEVELKVQIVANELKTPIIIEYFYF